ncbi:MAG: type II toxin-antitoxin system RatA family toxin [Desulfovibrionaceae bacterium]|jgi:ribosome-associated toxin RatA of RatAB toxin-antitoxin module|nr:type II toxin-antitoxin system RatA family toxin [Desulfovibrionaceae bacterium]
MKTVRKSVLIWHSAREMFDLVTDPERYPQFLPWCSHARVLWRSEQGMEAELGLAFMGVRQSFVTRNEHVINESGVLEERLRLVSGPFSRLEGRWQFTPVGQAGERACRVDLTLDYGFSSGVLARLVGPVFDKIANSMVDAFVKRAQQVYGAQPA